MRYAELETHIIDAPLHFEWYRLPVTVHGGDYQYDGILLCTFPKLDPLQIRCIVQDPNGRLFIHNIEQLESLV